MTDEWGAFLAEVEAKLNDRKAIVAGKVKEIGIPFPRVLLLFW